MRKKFGTSKIFLYCTSLRIYINIVICMLFVILSAIVQILVDNLKSLKFPLCFCMLYYSFNKACCLTA